MKMTKTGYVIALMTTFCMLCLINVMSGAAEMDSRIESKIKNSYNFKTALKDQNIEVSSKNGVVTLSGTVSSEVDKSLAFHTAEGTQGVQKVNNNLAVKDGGATSLGATDAWVTTKIKTMLLFSDNVSAKTDVSTNNGIVTLRGTAENEEQKKLTAEYVKDIEGVKEVKNEMTVASGGQKTGKAAGGTTMGETMDDASLTARVKMALLYNSSTSALHTSVNSQNGTVTVTGQAKNPAQKDLVSKVVKNVSGVKEVDNRMTVG